MKTSIPELLGTLRFLPNRTPEMAFTEEGKDAFAEVAPYRDGAIYVGHYSGSSEWERHPQGDEIVMVISEGTTVVVLRNEKETRVTMSEGDLLVVPQGIWHRFEN